MTTLFLVRHAAHALSSDYLYGRLPGVHLSEEGRRQARWLARRFLTEAVDLVQASPRERTRETAQPIALATGRPLQLHDALDEVDFGEWTGASFESLTHDARWDFWNAHRSRAQAPGGERMRDVAARVAGHLSRLHAAYPEGRVVLVTHAEIVRTALLHALGAPLEAFHRIEVSLASVAILELRRDGMTVAALNEAAAA